MSDLIYDDWSIYKSAPAWSRRPLDLSAIHTLLPQIARIANHHAISWCVIGGAAVSLHLSVVRHPAAGSRSSCDLDIAANDIPTDRQISWVSCLLIGGRAGRLAGRRIDWIVREQSEDVIKGLFARTIAGAKSAPFGFPVAPANALAALKLCMPPRAFRPKDRLDCRLLIDAEAATKEGITEWLSVAIHDRVTKANAYRNLESLQHPGPAAA